MTEITGDYEIILVNDGSPDKSWAKIVEATKADFRVKGLQLSRNFGQHYAITAGLDFAKGEWIVVMDCDLQDNPSEIPKLFAEALKGYDIVFARPTRRKDKFIKKALSGLFYRVYNFLSGLNFDGGIANFGIYHSRVIDEFKKMNERSRSFPSLIQYLGFNSASVPVQHSERFEGKSSYTYYKLFQLATNVTL